MNAVPVCSSVSSPRGVELSDRELRAWVFLVHAVNGPDRLLRRLVDQFGVCESADAVRRCTFPAGFEDLSRLSRQAPINESDDLRTAERIGARLLIPGSDEWPTQSFEALDGVSTEDGGGAPFALWCRGPARLADVGGSAIALIGSRAATSYGESVAASLAASMVANGRPLLGGANYGIESAAARAAIDADGVVAALMPCGIDRVYPVGNAALVADIADRGIVVSEYTFGIPAARHRFAQRSRLVAALSAAATIVEAPRRSGALDVARWASIVGTPIGVVPGPITSPHSCGGHALVAAGDATLVTDGPSILELADRNN